MVLKISIITYHSLKMNALFANVASFYKDNNYIGDVILLEELGKIDDENIAALKLHLEFLLSQDAEEIFDLDHSNEKNLFNTLSRIQDELNKLAGGYTYFCFVDYYSFHEPPMVFVTKQDIAKNNWSPEPTSDNFNILLINEEYSKYNQ